MIRQYPLLLRSLGRVINYLMPGGNKSSYVLKKPEAFSCRFGKYV